MNLNNLRKPFKEADLEWRVGRSGSGNKGLWAKVLVYVTNRAIQDRLDEVVGPENWENEFSKGPEGGVICGIGIRVKTPEGVHHVWKYDGAENSEIESIKGGLSNSMKRAAVQWGIGRYLYGIPESWAEITEHGKYSAKLKDGTWFKWNPPKLNASNLPEETKAPEDMGAAESRGKPPVQKATDNIEKVAEVFDGELVGTISTNGVVAAVGYEREIGQVTFQDIIKLVNSTSPPNMGEIVAKAKEAMDDADALKRLYSEITGTNGTGAEPEALSGNSDIPF